jgi:site-specific DNA recombinase
MKLRFAALRRVSTEQQEKTGESLATQTTEISEVVASLQGTIVEWYGGQEHATQGYEKKEVKRLLEDAQREPKKFDAVIVAHPDRWSRDNSASREGLEIFKAQNIRFFTGATEWDLFRPEHEFFLGMSAVVGHFFAQNQKRKSMLSRIARAKRGIPSIGSLPFGRIFKRSEDRQTGHWELDPVKHAMIQDLAKRYLAGESMADLAKEYGQNRPKIHYVLTRGAGPIWEVRFNPKALNIEETVKIEVPALLDEKTIAAVCARAEANRTYHHGHIKNRYLLSRMVRCAHCGSSLSGQTSDGLSSYRHLDAKRTAACPGPKIKSWVRADVLEDMVMRTLFETFGNPVAVQRAIEAATPNNEKVREAMQRLDQIAVEHLPKAKASIQRVIGLVAKGTITEKDAEEQLTKLKGRQQILEAELARIQDEIAHLPQPGEIKEVSKQIVSRFQYSSVKFMAKKQEANRAFKKMTWEEKRALCEMVFGGKTAQGERMGVAITWNESGKGWRFKIEGHLIAVEGRPLSETEKEGFFVFGGPAKQKELVTKSSQYSPGISLRSAPLDPVRRVCPGRPPGQPPLGRGKAWRPSLGNRRGENEHKREQALGKKGKAPGKRPSIVQLCSVPA